MYRNFFLHKISYYFTLLVTIFKIIKENIFHFLPFTKYIFFNSNNYL